MHVPFLPEQEATNLGSEEYNEVVLSVGDAVDPNKNLSSKRKWGNYNHYSPVHKSVNMLAKGLSNIHELIRAVL